MSFATRTPADRIAAAEREHAAAKAAVFELRTLVAEGKVPADALTLAQYRLAAAGKALTRIVTEGGGPQ